MKDSKIKKIKAREILDSRGNPTIEVELETDLGSFLASVPSGTSKGKYEAVEKEAKIAIKNINEVIAPKLTGKDPVQQKEIDEFLIKLDGTKRKTRLGANAILAVSIAVCRAGAKAKNFPLWKWLSKITGTKPALPRPGILVLEGGLHSKGDLSFQEIMVVSKAKSFRENFENGKKIFSALGKILKKKYDKSGIQQGMEGAFTPPIKNTKEALNIVMEAIEKAGFLGKTEIVIDAAANSFFQRGKYYFDGKIMDNGELLNFYLEIFRQYPIRAIEDPFAEDDKEGWPILSSKFLIVGDDLTVTNPERIKIAQKNKFCNGVIIKPNQIGTVSETIKATKLARSFGWKVIVSHRSGETTDSFISDFAVGVGAEFIKAGAPAKKERMEKYNRLVKIEEELHKN